MTGVDSTVEPAVRVQFRVEAEGGPVGVSRCAMVRSAPRPVQSNAHRKRLQTSSDGKKMHMKGSWGAVAQFMVRVLHGYWW